MNETKRVGHKKLVITASLILAAVLLGFLALAVNASKPGEAIEGCLRACSENSLDQDRILRVMSHNMLHGFPGFENLERRLDLIAAEILRLDADIVCLQETPWSRQIGSAAKYLSGVTRMNYVYLRANGNREVIGFEEGAAILSRYPLKAPTYSELKPQAGFFEHRIVLHAIAASPWGDIDIYVTHLTNGDEQINADQAGALMDYVEPTHRGLSIVAGDFNAREDSPQIQKLSRDWSDAYRQANPLSQGFTCCINDLNAPVSDSINKRIDYVFLASNEQTPAIIETAGLILGQPFVLPYGWQWASDHIGLLISLNLNPEAVDE